MGGVGLLGHHHQVATHGASLADAAPPALQVVLVELEPGVGHDEPHGLGGDRPAALPVTAASVAAPSASPGAASTPTAAGAALLGRLLGGCSSGGLAPARAVTAAPPAPGLALGVGVLGLAASVGPGLGRADGGSRGRSGVSYLRLRLARRAGSWLAGGAVGCSVGR